MAVANETVSQEMVDGTGIVPSNAPTSKVLAASGGSAIGGALGTIVTWMVCSHIEPPPLTDNVRGAIAMLVTAACGAVVAGFPDISPGRNHRRGSSMTTRTDRGSLDASTKCSAVCPCFVVRAAPIVA